MFAIEHNLAFAASPNLKVHPSMEVLTISDIPFTDLMDDPTSSLADVPRNKPLYVVCRFGNDSQLAVQTIKNIDDSFKEVKDIKGGLAAWAEAFPTDIIPMY